MRINRYLASSGQCSRRHADEFIFAGRVQVNGVQVTTPGLRVREGDRVSLDGKPVIPIKKKSYLVMNKPRGVITTRSDPQGRITVRDLLKKKPGYDHLRPVGRLDRDTCGVLLLTDDGELHHILTHPSKKVVKEYQVEFTHPLPLSVLKKLRSGISLEDGFLRPDLIDYAGEKNILRIRLHSGKNRIIRRLIEKVGGEIKILRRLSFAGVSGRTGKKELPEGMIRELSEEEVLSLKKMVGMGQV